MTQAKTLERLVCDGNARGCVELFAEMPEEERRSLAPHARRLLKESWQALEDDPNRFSAKANPLFRKSPIALPEPSGPQLPHPR